MQRRRPDEFVVVALGVALAAVFVAVQRGTIATYDGKIVYTVARSIVSGRLTVAPSEDAFGMHTPYSSYGIGISLVVAPLYLLQRALGVPAPLLVTLANPILLTGCGLLVHAIGRRLVWSARLSVVVALSFGLLTMALQDSQDLFSEPGVSVGFALVVLGLLRWRDDAGGSTPHRALVGPALAGSGLGVAILFRSDSLLLLAPLLLLTPWIVGNGAWRRVGALATAALPVAAALAWTAFYSYLRSGTLIPQQYGGTFSTPLLHGLDGLLLSPGKSLFVYNPILLLGLPGAVLLFRRQRAIAVLLAGFVVLRILFYARWSAWEGGVAWGPRFLMPCVVPLLLFAGEAVRRVPTLAVAQRRLAASAVLALVAASAVVSALSVWVPFEASFRAAVRTPGLTGQAAMVAGSERIDRYTFTVGPSAIPWNLRHLHGPLAMRHFRDGVTPTGLAAAVLAVGGAGAAVALAEPGAAAGSGRRRRVDPGAERDPEDHVAMSPGEELTDL